MDSKNRLKVLSIVFVGLMLLTSIGVVFESESSDAAVGDGGSYSYTITYNSAQMSSTSATLSVSNMNPINAPSWNGSTTSGYGSWTWNTTTGLGPFNSFYAAFDMSNGNRFVAILNPFDLTETIGGVDISSDLSHYNIMWVLPTVYWSTTSNSITLTNNPNAGGTAYAHTIDGHVYKYIAIGVYEGSTTTVNGQTVLISATGTTPIVSQTRATFRGYAHNYSMDDSLKTSNANPAYSMLWNFYQWELYRYCSLILMEDFNSQAVVGNGFAYKSSGSSSLKTTGLLDSAGPYAGTIGTITDNATGLLYGSDSVKLFIENFWGGTWAFVDGVLINGQSGIYIDSSSTPTDTTTVGSNVVYVQKTLKTVNGFSNAIITDSSNIWGFPTGSSNGSGTTGLADYYWGNTGGPFLMSAGGGANTGGAQADRDGISILSTDGALTKTTSDIGARLAFVFDVGPISTVTITTDQPDYGSVSPTTVLNVPMGTPITVSNNTLNINGTTVTATPRSANVQYSYAFSNWDVANNTQVMQDMTIKAAFTRSVNEYTVNFAPNDSNYGSVSPTSIANVPYGSSISVSNNQVTINGTTVTATPTSAGQEWTYNFVSWDVNSSSTTTDNMTITATFNRVHTEYTVNVQSNDPTYGTVDVNSIPNTPYGSVIHITDNVLTLNNAVVTATPTPSNVYYTYGFGGYTVQDGDIITGNTTITANFLAEEVHYVVLILPNNPDYGTVSVGEILTTYDQIIDINGNELTVNSVTSVATPKTDTAQYTYGFSGWSVADQTHVTQDMTVYANFTRVTNSYVVTVESSDDNNGTVSPTSSIIVEYGTPVEISGNTMSINSTTYTATEETDTAEYTYTFTGWSVANNYQIVDTTTITANFTKVLNYYDVTVGPNNPSYGTVSPSGVQNVPYGTTITTSGVVATVGSTTYTAQKNSDTAQYTYGFSGWNLNGPYTVESDTELTATFTRVVNTYTITWDYLGTTETETYEYGQMPTHADPVRTNYDFTGWSPAITTVTQNQTYTATWIPTVYTVTFNGSTGTPDVPSATGTVETAITLPDCTLPNNVFNGWYYIDGQNQLVLVGYAGDPYYPTSNITLYAQWALEVVYHFSLIYNANGGEGAPASQFYETTDPTEVTHDFTISNEVPVKSGNDFNGWATTSNATQPEYVGGDTITVSVDTPVTLFAVWKEDAAHATIMDIIGIIPYLVLIGLILTIVGAIIVNRRGMIETETMVAVIVGATVSIVAVVTLMIPMFNSL